MRFEQRGELLAQLVQLRPDRALAIRLKGVVGVVFLVIIFRRIKIDQRLQSGDDGIPERLGLVQFLDENRGFHLLLLVGVENRRAVLRTQAA